MAKTAEVLKIPATITERGQGVFRGRDDGAVAIAKKEPRADDGDPLIGRCLAFLARDMALYPARFRPVARSLVLRGKALVKGVRIDLDAPLPDDKA
jgi:antitoxin PrlF